MEVILDESSLVPCGGWSPALRIKTLASTLKSLDQLGCARILRSIRAAADQDIGQGRGLRGWCFDPTTDRDAGKFVAQRLGKQPFIDGNDGLFAAAEGERAIEGRVHDTEVVGLAFAALGCTPAVALGSTALPACTSITVDLVTLSIDDEFRETVEVCCVVTEEDVRQQSGIIAESVKRSVRDGAHLLAHAGELFPRLRFGPLAVRQIAALTGNEPVFHQLFRHLRALEKGAVTWLSEEGYSPAEAISWSRESNATLDHGTYGPLRDFPMPEGFKPRRWCDHTKLSGGAGARLYFRAERTGDHAVVLIGYFGDHLPTVRFGS